MKTKLRKATFTASAAVLLGLMLAGNAQAHCDAMDGPVITEARAALEAGDVTPLLKWVPAEDEAEIRRVFADVRDIRGQSEKVRKIADKHLFATLVKVHRASEGAPFTGIKPAGNIDPGLKEKKGGAQASQGHTGGQRLPVRSRKAQVCRFSALLRLARPALPGRR